MSEPEVQATTNSVTPQVSPSTGWDMPKIIVVGLIAAFLLFSLFKLFGANKAAPAAQITAASSAPAQKPVALAFKALETSGDKVAANALFKLPTQIKSCIYMDCKSNVYINNKDVDPAPKRGLNVYTLAEDGTAAFVQNFDMCADKQALKTAPKLSAILEKSAAAKAVLLVGHDSVSCDFQTGGIAQSQAWADGVGLDKLHKLGVRNGYFAAIVPKTKAVVYEMASDKSLAFDSTMK